MKSILITGCSSGIGAYCAEQLKADGWQVHATARKKRDIERLADLGFIAHTLDYGLPKTIDAVADQVLAATDGKLFALFNNGAYGQLGAVEDIGTDALRRQFDANFFGPHHLTKRLVPAMRANGAGRIVFCSSVLGLLPMRFRGPYCASKYALEGLAMAMRMELAGSGVHVSLIEPGAIATRFAENALPHFTANIDAESSSHRDAYSVQLKRLKGGGTKSRFKLQPRAVHTKLVQALNANHPRPHYYVCAPTHILMALKRFLPSSVFYRLLQKRG